MCLTMEKCAKVPGWGIGRKLDSNEMDRDLSATRQPVEKPMDKGIR